MICVLTRLFVVDNSGALYAQCIKILGSCATYARIGDRIVVAIKKARPSKKVKTHDVRIGIVVRTGRKTVRRTGVGISFYTNAVVLVDQRRNPVGTRVVGTVGQELRICKQMRIIVIAQNVI